MDELLEQIESGKLAPVYVLASEHAVLLDRVIAAIRDVAVPPAMRGFNYDVIEGKPSASRIVSLAQTLPMMAKMRMIYVRDIGLLPADESETLIEYFASPNPSTVLVAQTSKLDKRQKLYAQLGKRGWLHQLAAPRQLSSWLRSQAKVAKVEIEGKAIDRLIDVVGDDLSRLVLSLEQLALYANGATVLATHVDDLIAATKERSVFELTDAIGNASLPAALTAIASLCDQRESAIGVITMLARYVRQLLGVHRAKQNGWSKSDLPQRLGVPPFVVDKLIVAAKRYRAAALEEALHQLALADRAVKGDPTVAGWNVQWTGPVQKVLGRELGERLLLERVVTKLVAAAN